MQITGANTTLLYPKINTAKAGPSDTIGKDQAANSNSQPSKQLDSSSFQDTKAAILSDNGAAVITNPMDLFTQSDKDLVLKLTGLTVNNGNIYDASGDRTFATTPEAGSLLHALSDLRSWGTGVIGSAGAVTGLITADDLSQYVKNYSSRSEVRQNTPFLEKAIQSLETQEEPANRSQT